MALIGMGPKLGVVLKIYVGQEKIFVLLKKLITQRGHRDEKLITSQLEIKNLHAF